MWETYWPLSRLVKRDPSHERAYVVRMLLVAASVSLLATNAACSPKSGDTAPPTAIPSVARDNEWLEAKCREVGAAITADVLCPTWLPVALASSSNNEILKPSTRGYLFESEGIEHWVLAANKDKRWERGYGDLTRVARVKVRGRNGVLLAAPETAGIFALHVLLAWDEGPFRYLVSVHAPAEQATAVRSDLVRVAERMQRY